MVIHGNRMEDLQQLAIEWSRANPLPPLAPEVFLVQSNGIAQWMKMALAASPREDGSGGMGVATAVDVMLPARFQWLAYRRVIEAVEGRGAVPTVSPFDKPLLRWRLLRLLPEKLDEPVYAPLAKFLGDDPDQRKHFQLAERLADLFDQYQVYRADWLESWLAGRDHIVSPQGVATELEEDDRWQAQLWRDIHEDMTDNERATHRAAIHTRYLEDAKALTPDTLPAGLPRRVVVFGISALPQQTLEALEALSSASQVVLCTLNPCQHYWGDIVEDKELLRSAYRRQARRDGMPDELDLDDLHLHAHPLLAAWGKQGRDYLHLLDEHDEREAYQGLFQHHGLRIDLFQPGQTETLLGQLQDDILNLRPARESLITWAPVDPRDDTSLQFTMAHSAQREVEILHDQLLSAFAADPSLQPRDVIVMVPDADTFGPFIHAVFGQYGFRDRRHIPYQLADQKDRHHAPLMVALETLLNLPRLRVSASDVLDLLDVPALRHRFGLAETDLATLKAWIEGANIRWGLHAEQRTAQDLPSHDERNSWRFGLERMLAGFALGDSEEGLEDWEHISPFTEVGGLDAALIGPLYQLTGMLDHYWRQLGESRSVQAWAPLLRQLLSDFFAPQTREEERLILSLEDGLVAWLDEAEGAAFEEPLPLHIVRDTWLDRVDASQLSQRFIGGAVTIATLMPMRAIPFEHVYLLGMNDGDYPRQSQKIDFDLMARKRQYRPGDRSRREDDRYLLLEALLSARKRLSISWVGRSIRDNAERTPSVLVGQLRDHIATAWRMAGVEGDHSGTALLDALTTEHPLQPFGEAYFRRIDAGALSPSEAIAASRLVTYSREWEHLHRPVTEPATEEAPSDELSPWMPAVPLTLPHLARFLRRPIDQLYRQRLNVYFHDRDLESEDAEPFGFDELQLWQQQDAVLQPVGQQLRLHPERTIETVLTDKLSERERQGELPHPPFTESASMTIAAPLYDQLERYQSRLRDYPHAVAPAPEVSFIYSVVALEDSIDQVQRAPDGHQMRLVLETSKLHEGDHYKWTSLIKYWPAHLALQLVAPMTPTVVVGQSGDVEIRGMSADDAQAILEELLDGWLYGMQAPLALTCKAGFKALDEDVAHAEQPNWAAVEKRFAEDQKDSLVVRRHFEDFGTLCRDGLFLNHANDLYAPFHRHLTSKEAD
ncbi:exodeoxyribonuclease V subunit gamma [Halomonas sp. I5-271120]|uniref:exodeoxyribonuclease V subunit gamma n=1 Tax=Halomonas sp. I5-271120 TaxID=3061632 RepID=UPI0027E81A81